MTTDSVQTNPLLPSQAFSSEELQQIARNIVDSGELGRSKIYANLLNYLIRHASDGKSPKEIEIAIEVLGRDASFDVSKDSVVRVYVHQLRKKLDNYYRKHEQEAQYRIIIPRGQYTIAVVPAPSMDTELAPHLAVSSSWRRNLTRLVWAPVIAMLLLGNLYYLISRDESNDSEAAAASLQPWSAVLDDNIPVLFVMGDYYIFGELNELGNVTRMIRDFSINSSQDLNTLFMQKADMSGRYRDLDLNYMPEGSALALAKIVPLLQKAGKQINVTMMSRLNTADLKSNHIIYIGYISALDKLRGLVFANSGLQIGRTYDELLNRRSGEIYSSDAGLPSEDEPFRDYGLFSTFPSTSQNQFVIIAGTRDAGLMHTAQAVADGAMLDAIEQSIATPVATGTAHSALAYEALFEVFGFNRMNFDANLVYSRTLDPGQIWGGVLTSMQ